MGGGKTKYDDSPEPRSSGGAFSLDADDYEDNVVDEVAVDDEIAPVARGGAFSSDDIGTPLRSNRAASTDEAAGSDMSAVGEIEAKTGVLGEKSAAPGRVREIGVADSGEKKTSLEPDELRRGLEAVRLARREAKEKGEKLDSKRQATIFYNAARPAVEDQKTKLASEKTAAPESKETPKGVDKARAAELITFLDRARAARANEVDQILEAARETYIKDRIKQYKEFENKYYTSQKKHAKTYGEIDENRQPPDVEDTLLDIERWASNKNKPGVKPLHEYASHEELRAAMADFRTKAEQERDEQERLASGAAKGMKTLDETGAYKTYDITTPEALMTLANQGTNWCTKDPKTARNKLKVWNYQVITKADKPIFALKTLKPGAKKTDDPHEPIGDEEVLYTSDFDVKNGKRYADTKFQALQMMSKSDFDYANKMLVELGRDAISRDYVKLFDTKEDMYKYIEEVFDGDKRDKMYEVLRGFKERLPRHIENKIIEKGLDMAVEYAGAIRQRLPYIEEELAHDGDPMSIANYATAIGTRFPARYREIAEKNLVENGEGEVLTQYAKAMGGTWQKIVGGQLAEEAEAAISFFPAPALEYARDVVKKRFLPAENVIANWGGVAVEYAQKVLKGTWADVVGGQLAATAENSIAGHGLSALDYARNVLGKRFEGGEPAIADRAEYSYEYARDVLGGSWQDVVGGELAKKAESIISSSPNIRIKYAQEQLRGRFEDAGREYIMRGSDPFVREEANRYAEIFGLVYDPDKGEFREK